MRGGSRQPKDNGYVKAGAEVLLRSWTPRMHMHTSHPAVVRLCSLDQLVVITQEMDKNSPRSSPHRPGVRKRVHTLARERGLGRLLHTSHVQEDEEGRKKVSHLPGACPPGCCTGVWNATASAGISDSGSSSMRPVSSATRRCDAAIAAKGGAPLLGHSANSARLRPIEAMETAPPQLRPCSSDSTARRHAAAWPMHAYDDTRRAKCKLLRQRAGVGAPASLLQSQHPQFYGCRLAYSIYTALYPPDRSRTAAPPSGCTKTQTPTGPKNANAVFFISVLFRCF